jgi:hypothetical protein
MAGLFNPSDPIRVGLEWYATSDVAEPVDFASELGMTVTATSNKTLQNVQWYAPGPPIGGEFFTSWVLATVYESGSEMSFGAIDTSAAVVTGGSTTGALVGAGSLAAAVAAPGDGAYVRLDPGELVRARFTIPTFLTPAPRILNVQFLVGVSPDTTSSPRLDYRYAAGQVINLASWIQTAPASGGPSTIITLDTGEVFLAGYDYATTPTEARRRVWLPSDFTSLNNGTIEFQVRSGSTQNIMDIDYIGMIVTYCEENRVGVGGQIRSRNANYPWAPGWQPDIDMIDPATGSVGVSLLSGRDYTLTVTRAADARLSVQEADVAGAVLAHQSGVPRDISSLRSLDGEALVNGITLPRLVSGVVAAPAVSLDRAYAIIGKDAVGASIPFISQPYAQAIGSAVTPPTTQTITSGTGGKYTTLTLPVRRFGAPADLVITIGAVTATLTSAAYDLLEPDDDGYVLATLDLSATLTMVAGVPVTVSAASGSGVNRWQIPALSTTNSGAVYTSATYGGAALLGQADARQDYPVTIAMPSPAVTGTSIGAGIVSLAAMIAGCPQPAAQFTSLDYVSFAWGAIPVVSGAPAASGAPLVTGFCAWEVERSDSEDPLWRRIARVSDYNIRAISDFEARIGVLSSYRVRLCRLDGVCGGWSTTSTYTRAGPTAANGDACDGLVFTSNEDPFATVAYPLSFSGTVTEDFTFIEAETVTMQRLHMRDYQVAFRPLERGGVSFTRTVLVNALVAPADTLDRGFTSLRDLAWESLSYVAVLDTRGNRWFAAVIVPAGQIRSPLEVYLADVTIIEVTDRPSVIDVEAF